MNLPADNIAQYIGHAYDTFSVDNEDKSSVGDTPVEHVPATNMTGGADQDLEAFAQELFAYAATLPDEPTWLVSAQPPARVPTDIVPAARSVREADIDGIGGVIAWHERKYFLYFKSHEDLRDYVLGLEHADRVLYEKCYPTQRQKLRLDIDAKVLTLDDIAEIKTAMMCAGLEAFGELIAAESIIVCDSSNEEKKSVHMIVAGYFVESNILAGEFARGVKSRLEARLAECIDMCVYNRGVGLRLPWCHKIAAPSVSRTKKTPVGLTGDPFLQCLLTYVEGCRELKLRTRGIETAAVPQQPAINNDQAAPYIARVLELCPGHAFRDCRGGCINFNRMHASPCHISGREHTHDNTLFATVTHGKLYARCRHCIGALYICDVAEGIGPAAAVPEKLKKPKKTPVAVQQDREARVRAICARDYPTKKWKSSEVIQYKGVMNESRDFMDEYPDDVPTLHICAAMGCGKTEALRRHIARVQPKSVLVISHRVSFTIDICAKFGYKSYREIAGEINTVTAPFVVVQCESMYKVALERYEMVICDEIESIMTQMFAPTHRRANCCWTVFARVLLLCDRLITMDGNLTQETIDVVSEIRDVRSVVIHNTAIPRGTVHKITTNKAAAVALLMSLIARGDRVVAPTSSLSMAKKLEKMIREKFPGRRVMMYTSETPDDVREETLRNVNAAWINYDVLIYTPTISAGLSFNVHHFDSFVGFWYDTSCDIFVVLQMSWRARNIGSGVYYHYVSESGRQLLDTVDALRAHVSKSLDHACEYMPDPEVKILPDGRVKHRETSRFHAWLNITARRNYSQTHFLEVLARELKRLGATVEALVTSDTADPGEEKAVRGKLRAIGEGIKREDAEAVAAAAELTAEDIEGLHRGVIPPKPMLQKYYLRRCYDYRGEVTPAIARTYGEQSLKLQYHARKNLREVADEVFAAPETALQTLGRRFAGALTEDLAAAQGSEVDSLRKLFDFNRDSVCVKMLSIFGLRIGDARQIPRDEVLAALRPDGDGYKWLRANCKFICDTFETKTITLPEENDPNFLKGMTGFISGKLKSRYGISFKIVSKHSNHYHLEDPFAKLFNDNFEISMPAE